MESEHAPWVEPTRTAFSRYDEALLRLVAGKLFRPRNQWPADELVDRSVETLANPPVIDRRLRELPPSSRQLLAIIGLSRQSHWSVGQLLALLATLGHAEGLAPILVLLDSGLGTPILPESIVSLRQWEDWLGTAPETARLYVPLPISQRATQEETGFPVLPGKNFDPQSIRVADGLEWPLRLGVLWQQLRTGPVRLTQADSLFKRDLQRLQTDPLLASPLADHVGEIVEPGVFAMVLGKASGLFETISGERHANTFPESWNGELPGLLGEFWAALPAFAHWDPLEGHLVREGVDPFSTVALAAMLLLARQESGNWTHPSDIAEFIVARHPSWSATLGKQEDAAENWMESLLLGWAWSLRLVEAAQDGEGWWVRLSDVGRHLLRGEPAPNLTPPFTQCLVIQPNADVIAYRQGLTPPLIAKLSRFSDWKMLGPACTLSISAESVYRGLEAGSTLGDIFGTLQQHGSHALPANVADLIRHWAGRRERISVYRGTTLLEFQTPEDLEHAVSRGLVTQRLTDRIGLSEIEVDYRQVRLLGNRDYEAKPQRCVNFTEDGVTFTVDVAASDLLLEAELSRLAEWIPNDSGERRYRITPRSALAVREAGLTLGDLEQWFNDRAGIPLSPSTRLLLNGHFGTSGEVKTRLVVEVASEVVADGICQWPSTAAFIGQRLGPTALAIEQHNLDPLLEQLKGIGVEIRRT
jgi:hypothetical protein